MMHSRPSVHDDRCPQQSGGGTSSEPAYADRVDRPEPTSVRVDAWVWAIRLFPTRSAAKAACTASHVKVNGANAKPAHPLHVGDTVRALTPGGERIVVVTGLIDKRTSAALAVQKYEDHSPPPPPKEQRIQVAVRERGAGRPTKRDRRRTERLRGRA
jgi:ribosome-associated heat shock protein Hsp15